MIELTQKSFYNLAKAARNKGNNVMTFVTKKTNGATEMSQMILDKNRDNAVKALKGMIPQDSGKVFCTFF